MSVTFILWLLDKEAGMATYFIVYELASFTHKDLPVQGMFVLKC